MRIRIAILLLIFGASGSLALAGTEEDGSAGRALVGDSPANEVPAILAAPYPGYILYLKDVASLPAPSCYWTRMPIYDSRYDVIGWRGRPVPVCPRKDASARQR